MIELGKHYIVDFLGCDREKLARAETSERIVLEAVDKSRATYISHLSHQFDPAGATVVVLIAESHFSLHTWPEHAYAGFDIFTCGTMDAEAAIEHVGTALGAQETRVDVSSRGV